MLSHVQLFETPWTVTRQAPLSMESPGKNTGVGGHALLQGIFLTPRSNLGLPCCKQILYRLGHQGSPGIYYYSHFQARKRGSGKLSDLLTVAQVGGSRVISLTLLLTCKDPMMQIPQGTVREGLHPAVPRLQKAPYWQGCVVCCFKQSFWHCNMIFFNSLN